MAFFKILSLILIAFICNHHQVKAQQKCNASLELMSQNENENVYKLKIDEPLLSSTQKNQPMSCWLTFETFPNYGIKVEFDKFVFQEPDCFNNPSSDGCCDYLDIGYGSEVDLNVYKRFCGLVQIEPFILNSNKMWLKYSIENYDSFEGALIRIKPFKLVLNKEKTGIIKSDADYYNNLNLTYKIIVENDSIINFNFVKKFSIEKFSDACVDYVEIGELDPVSLAPTGNGTKYCGEEMPSQFSLNTQTAYVRVFTNENVLGDGFWLEYSAVKYLFTEPTGTIVSPSKLMNITYKIVAPEDKKIELTINEFKFYPCINEDMDLVAQQISSFSNDICSLNHHLIISNQKGKMSEDFYDMIRPDSEDEWKFCDCFKPVRKYVSLSNELVVRNVLGDLSSKYLRKDDSTKYSISYKFINSEFKESNQIRIVQDMFKLSPINGYLLQIRVPPNNHLRIYGKSNKCVMPKLTVLRKSSWDFEFQKLTALKLQLSDFKHNNCEYLFDLSEPIMNSNTTWTVDWYLKFNSPLEQYDFEVNWMFIQNKIVEEKKSKSIQLPAQFGFDLSEDLVFNFESKESKRNYLIRVEIDQSSILGDSEADLTPIVIANNKNEESILPQTKSESKRIAETKLDSVESSVKFKRTSKWTYNLNYQLESNNGDCDFDSSFCNYTNENARVKHLPKFLSINTYYEQEVIDKEFKDFYLSVSRLNENSPQPIRVASPLIRNQNSESINSKVLMLSFNYMMLKGHKSEIDIKLISNRSDVDRLVKKYSNVTLESIGRLDNLNKEKLNVNTKLSAKLNECPNKRFASFIDDKLKVEYEPIWYRVDKLSFFTCFDFNLVFDIKLDAEQINSVVGLDDIQLDYGRDLEECDSKEECNSHGTCLEFNSNKTCCCDPGYAGEHCEEEISPCGLFSTKEIDICKNNGTCVDLKKNFDYKCQCLEGYTGEHCEFEINECELEPCKNNGQCIDQIGSYKCICQIGYNGTNCEIESPGCKEKCSNEGTLKCYENKKNQNILCKCLPGYSGDDCSKRIQLNECDSNPCVGEDSKCIDKIDGFECVCSEKRSGRFCEHELDYCEDYGHLCANNSKCLYANKDGSEINCSCELGFTGIYCNETIPIDYCKPNPCHDGICIQLELGYKCDCPKGAIGFNCDIKPEYPCQKNKCVHGFCLELSASDYTCSCYGTYTGEFCDKEMCNKENYLNDYCVKENTLDVVKDPLFEDKNQCLCLCKNGFKGSRCEIQEDICEIINEKDMPNYGSQCHNGGTCTYDQEQKRMKCLCANGYSGDRCQVFKNYCQSNPCKYGQCQSLEESYVCKCTDGWEGIHCDQEKKMCDINEDCVAENTESIKYSFSDSKCICKCKNGYEGYRCQINFDDCLNNKCKNGAKCVDKIGSYECQCPKGFMGVFCEKKIEKCAAFPCKNGTCEELGVGFRCNCDKGFTGEFCETLIDKCAINPCKNGATCHNLIDDYYCECPPEFGSSRNCSERSIDPCIISPCLNNATCTALSTFSREKSAPVYTGFSCKCSSNFRGELCEQPADICSSNPCKNHGRCIIPKENRNDYKCLCFPAFTGKSCEHLYDECVSKPCNNGGTCLASPEGFRCKCPHNFSGKTCETPLEPCDSMKCLNGGKCSVGIKNIPYCECPDKRFTGTQCEIDLSKHANSSDLVKLKLSSEHLEIQITCDILGNDVTLIDYIFATMMLFLILIIIIVIVYIYVQINIRRTKRFAKESNFEHDVSTEPLANQYK